MTTEVRLSVIVPARNAGLFLGHCTAALSASDLPRSSWELIIVDDGSEDDTASVARERADHVIHLARAHGPAYARNRGAEVAHGAVLAFVDADVCVHASTLRCLLEALAHEEAAAVFGAYDTTPSGRGLVSQYRNLLHHYVHAGNAGDADTFWAGCGAIRRQVFLDAGGFDEVRYSRPQIEDIELGYRLRARGHRILLRPEIQGTHLKRWSLGGMVRGDLFDRGVPWMRLLLGREAAGRGSLNIRRIEKLLVALAGGAMLAWTVALLTLSWIWLAAGVALLFVIVLANHRFLRWLAQNRGAWFALGAVPLHLLYYMLNAAAVGIAIMQQPFARPDLRGRGVGSSQGQLV